MTIYIKKHGNRISLLGWWNFILQGC
jgi:hypothetical protein